MMRSLVRGRHARRRLRSRARAPMPRLAASASSAIAEPRGALVGAAAVAPRLRRRPPPSATPSAPVAA